MMRLKRASMLASHQKQVSILSEGGETTGGLSREGGEKSILR